MCRFSECIIKDEKWYADEVSDTTMLPIAVFLFGQYQHEVWELLKTITL
jgi:hypothetical protein